MPWRPMTPEDLPQVQVLADRIHVDHPEDFEVLAERQRLYPQGCFMLVEDGAAYRLRAHASLALRRTSASERAFRLPPERPRPITSIDVALLPATGKGLRRAGGRIPDRTCPRGRPR